MPIRHKPFLSETEAQYDLDMYIKTSRALWDCIAISPAVAWVSSTSMDLESFPRFWVCSLRIFNNSPSKALLPNLEEDVSRCRGDMICQNDGRNERGNCGRQTLCAK